MPKQTLTMLIDSTAKKTRNEKKITKDILQTFLENVKKALQSGNYIEIVGFGKFFPKDYASRTIISPIDKKENFIKQKKVAKFKASKQLNKYLND